MLNYSAQIQLMTGGRLSLTFERCSTAKMRPWRNCPPIFNRSCRPPAARHRPARRVPANRDHDTVNPETWPKIPNAESLSRRESGGGIMAENPFCDSAAPARAHQPRADDRAYDRRGFHRSFYLPEFFISPTQFFRSWMIGFLFPFALGLGSLACLMLQYMSGGAWGMVDPAAVRSRVANHSAMSR